MAPPTSSAPGPSNPSLPATPEQCLTPPSVRRREDRIARCVYYAAGQAGERQAVGEDGDGSVTEGEPRQDRRNYGAEEVEARRVGRRATAWAGWDAQLESYQPVALEGGLVRPDGTVDWDALPSLPPSAAENAADSFQHARFTAPPPTADDEDDFLRDLDGPVTLPSPPSTFALPSTFPSLTLPGGVDTAALPANTLPIVLGALYVAARAMGVGSRRVRGGEAANGVEAKVRRF